MSKQTRYASRVKFWEAKGRLKSLRMGKEEYSPLLFDGGEVKPGSAGPDESLGLDKALNKPPHPEGLCA